MDKETVRSAVADTWKEIIVTNPDGSKTVTLTKAIKVLGEDTDKLTLRKLSPKDFRKLNTTKIKEGDGGAIADAVCLLAGIPPTSFDELDGADCDVLGSVVQGFLVPSRLIGGALSRISAQS